VVTLGSDVFMFRTVPLSIIRILFTVNSAMVYVTQVYIQLSSRSICSCSEAAYKPVNKILMMDRGTARNV